MALSSRQLTQLHRRQQLALREATRRDIARLWPALQWVDLDASFEAFAAPTRLLIARYRATSAALAARYVRAHRIAAGHGGRVDVALPEPLPDEQVNVSLVATSVAPLKNASANGVEPAAAMRNGLTLVSGAVARLVLDGGRRTVAQTAAADPEATGWRRVLGGGGCDFCRMLAGRGGVYGAESVDFEAHDHCGCTAEPVYG